MPESLVEVLTKFHSGVVRPDMERIVHATEERLRDEMHGLFDALAQRMDRLETEAHMTVAGLKRIEERLDKIEARLDRVEGRLDKVEGRLGSIEETLQKTVLRTEIDTLKARVNALQKQIQDIEARL